MTNGSVPSERRTVRSTARALTALALSMLAWGAAPAIAAAEAGDPSGNADTEDATAISVQQVAELGPANAAAQDVQQSVAIVDRTTGELVASYGGDEVYNTESILKLFTAAYYLVQADGAPDADLAEELRELIVNSDDDIQSALWQQDIVPTIADRFGLTNTSNGPSSSPSSWGSDRTTANDQALFLYRMSLDPEVGPTLMAAMAATGQTGLDGFNQEFGFNALAGEHGSKQGWSDPDWSPANLHSVGWTGRYFAAILQNSPTAKYATMRATSTRTARLIAEASGEVSSAPGIDDLGRSIAEAVQMTNLLVTLGVTEPSDDPSG